MTLEAKLASETGRFADANGQLTLSCVGLAAGDGKTPLKVPSIPMLAQGITLPRIRIGDLGGHVAIEKGTAKLQGVESKSPDGEVALEGDIALHDPLSLTTLNLYLRFKLSEAVMKKEVALPNPARGRGGRETARRLLRREVRRPRWTDDAARVHTDVAGREHGRAGSPGDAAGRTDTAGGGSASAALRVTTSAAPAARGRSGSTASAAPAAPAPETLPAPAPSPPPAGAAGAAGPTGWKGAPPPPPASEAAAAPADAPAAAPAAAAEDQPNQ